MHVCMYAYEFIRVRVRVFVWMCGFFSCRRVRVCIYVCIYVWMYVYMYVGIYVCTYIYMYICMYVYMYVCMYTCMYVCIYVWMSICMYVCLYVCMYICIYVCMYVYMYICMYVFMYVCICFRESRPVPPVLSSRVGRGRERPRGLQSFDLPDGIATIERQLSWGKLRREPANRRLDWSFAPTPGPDDRFARQRRFGLPPEFPLASCRPGVDRHLSGGPPHMDVQKQDDQHEPT